MASNAENEHSARRDLTGYFIYVLLIATLGPLQFGYHIAELNPPEQVLRCLKGNPDKKLPGLALPSCIPMTNAEFGTVSSAFTVGGLVGALASGPLAAKFGRILTTRLATTCFILGPLAEALAPSISVLVLGRFLAGLSAGAAVVVIPIYISEIAPPRQKGFFGSFTQVGINIGILVVQLLGLFLSHGSLWRIILGIGGVAGLSQAIGLLLAVESPKWDAEHGNPTRARKNLKRLRGHDCDLEVEVKGWQVGSARERRAEEESLLHDEEENPTSDRGLSASRETIKEGTVGIFNVLLHPQYKRATITVMVVMIAQQLCGINSIIMFGVKLLTGLLAASSGLLNVFVALLNLIVTLSCAPLIDKIGRKPCLILSISGMGISSLLLAIAIIQHVPILAAITVMTFVGSFGLGLGPIPFILSSELVGAEAVGATQSWALAANWTATFVVSQFFPIVDETLGQGRVFFIFAALAVIFASFVAWFVPETKGKSDADEVWGRATNRERRED